jgi:hypothetical protein
MSALLLALLHGSILRRSWASRSIGEGSSGNVLLDSLSAGSGPGPAGSLRESCC